MNKNSKEILEFTLVYNKYKSGVYNYTLKMTNDAMLCDDIVQNVFVKFFEHYNNIRDKSIIKFWLFKTTRNEIYSFLRKKKVRSGTISFDEDFEVSGDVGNGFEYNFEMKELKKIIMNILNTLPQEQREVYLLKEYAGLTYKEIAKITETSEDLVKSRLYKTRAKLIKKVAKIVT